MLISVDMGFLSRFEDIVNMLIGSLHTKFDLYPFNTVRIFKVTLDTKEPRSFKGM